MIDFDPVKAAIAPYALAIKVGVTLLLAASLFIGGCQHGKGKWQGKYADEAAAHQATKDRHASVLGDLAEKTKAAAAKAKAASAQAKADIAAADDRFKQAKQESDDEIAGLRRDLRNRTVQLRPEFACAAPRPAEGGAAAAAGGEDAGAGLRQAREGAILDDIADHDRADRWIGWLQSTLIATYKACGAVP